MKSPCLDLSSLVTLGAFLMRFGSGFPASMTSIRRGRSTKLYASYSAECAASVLRTRSGAGPVDQLIGRIRPVEQRLQLPVNVGGRKVSIGGTHLTMMPGLC